ncbi:LysR family transcriptional regulator [Ramlibacter sp. AW1]|uniref:LysR family transcriptional regulator n=1 Tax=Ramlibacter aurantiacus TaxID=2801330 RepID=A0A937D5E6_9BURK|nr:LysR family transcriptional regulator [Ramlibacter aurantiacus]
MSTAWDLSRLRLFLLVLSEGSLTRTAVASGLTQPFVSRQIARLEEECGGKLFLRTGRGMTLSDFGEQLLPRIRALVEDADELTATVRERRGLLAGEVTLGVLSSLSPTLVVPLFLRLRALHPGIRLRVMEGSVAHIDQWVASGAVDLGVTYDYGNIGAGSESLARVSSYLVSAKGDRLTQTDNVPFRKLDGLPMVLPSAMSSIRVLLRRLEREAAIKLEVLLEAESGQIQRALTAHAGTYTIAAYHAIEEEVRKGQLQAACIIQPEIIRTIAMSATTVRATSGAARETARLIRELFADKEMQSRLGGTNGLNPR